MYATKSLTLLLHDGVKRWA